MKGCGLPCRGRVPTTLAGVSPASAQKVESGSFHDETTDTDPSFCGVTGLEVEIVTTVDDRFLGRTQGSDALFYGLEHLHVVTVYTNTATGQRATDIQPSVLNKDLHVSVDDAGTTTIDVLATGGERTYGDSGRLIARNSGQIRLRIVLDADGNEVSNVQTKGSTGTNDDFCAAVLADWKIA